jgi:hypothetical protein
MLTKQREVSMNGTWLRANIEDFEIPKWLNEPSLAIRVE